MGDKPKSYMTALWQIRKLKIKCWLYFFLGLVLGASAVLVYFIHAAGQ